MVVPPRTQEAPLSPITIPTDRQSNNPYRNGIYLLHKQGAGSQFVVELEGTTPQYEIG